MYNNLYDNAIIRNKDYSVEKYISKHYHKDYLCLDIGCGSCRKIIPLCNNIFHYFAIDNDPKRIKTAKHKCKKISNITLGVADSSYLPFENKTFDLVSCFMTKYNIGEIHRVLKKNGILIIETTGANDKRDLKKAFGKDILGWRGRMLSDTSEERKVRLLQELSPFFETIDFHVVSFKTHLPLNIFIELTRMTNDIRNFGKYSDLKKIYSLRNTEGRIEFEEERIIIVAKKY